MQFKQKETKKRPQPAAPCDSPAPSPTEESATPQENDPQGLLVHHGIHEGTYRVAGLSVAQIRRMFSRSMNIAPDAVAVIAGEVVEDEDERVILDTDHMLNFVQRSSVKGTTAY